MKQAHNVKHNQHNRLKMPLIPGLLRTIFFTVLISLFLLGAASVYGVSDEWNGNAATGFAGGTGTETDPYLISTAEQLAYFAGQVNKSSGNNTYAGQYIRLTQDILLNRMNADGTFVSSSPRPFPSIGSLSKPFKGTFDGNGFEIIGLDKGWDSSENKGLFGYAGDDSVIMNLIISGKLAAHKYAGVVAGYTNGTITGCVVNCPVVNNWTSYHGGIAGKAGPDSIISNCTVLSSVEGTDYIGGIVGYTEGEVFECEVRNTVDGGGATKYAGGIAGYAGPGSDISNCTVLSNVKGKLYIGGIVGYTEGKVLECEASNTVSGEEKVGGIAGYSKGVNSVIEDCVFTGTISGTGGGQLGGIAGQAEGLINGCTAVVTVSGSNGNMGGIVGYAAGAASLVTNCTVSGNVTPTGGYGYIGGVAGKTDGKITGCVSECAVTGTDQHYVGGIVGSAATGSEVSSSSSSGTISGLGKVGGIAGYTDGVVQICINTGTVNGGGSGHTGGIAGEAGNNGTVSNSYNAGAVSGEGQGSIGGIVGHVNDDTEVYHNLNKGSVSGNEPVGSVIGNTVDPDNVWNNYYYDNYPGAPGGSSGSDINDDDGAVPVGEMTWEEICDLLNTDNDAGDNVWNQDAEDEEIPKPGEGSGSSSDPVFTIQDSWIKEGKYYTVAELETSTAAVVTAESVFTAAYSLKYNESCALQEQTLRLKSGTTAVQLPTGTSIIMLAGGSYYYWNLTDPAATVTAVTLEDFIKMGSLDDSYNPASAAQNDVMEYLFIIDFSKTAVSNQVATGSYSIALSDPNGNTSDTLPVVTVTDNNVCNLTVSGAPNMFTVGFSLTPAVGYDYKTAGKELVYEFWLEQGVAGGTVIKPWPIGAKLNGYSISSDTPYALVPVGSGAPVAVLLDMSECDIPLAAGQYTLKVKVYSSSNSLKPRDGYVLGEGSSTLTLTAPIIYAIRAGAQDRVFNQSSSSIPVVFTIQTLGSNTTIKSTLQKKYATTTIYIDVEGEIAKPVSTSFGSTATVYLPANSPKGTYRYVLTLHDDNGTEKTRTVKNIIVK